MIWSNVRLCTVFDVSVVFFQVIGVTSLCLTRLLPTTRWADRGQIGFVLALIGLGMAGALCGRHDSAFALFAGGTMTLLLIGMTMGSGQADTIGAVRGRAAAEPNLAGSSI